MICEGYSGSQIPPDFFRTPDPGVKNGTAGSLFRIRNTAGKWLVMNAALDDDPCDRQGSGEAVWERYAGIRWASRAPERPRQ